MTDQNNGADEAPATFHPAVHDFVNHISKTFQDRDALIAENLTLRTRAEIAEGMVAHLKDLNEKVTKERDLYMRRTFSLTTNFMSVRSSIDAAFEAVEAESTADAGDAVHAAEGAVAELSQLSDHLHRGPIDPTPPT